MADSPAKALPLLLPADESAYRISENPWMPGLSTPAWPAATDTASAVPPSTSSGVARMTMETIFMSKASIFLPRYSGVRPIISPAMKTPRMAKASMPYRPEPTPPNTTSPSCMSSIGDRPPIAENESCMPFTAPQDAAVVTVAKSDVAAMPKRVSLPSMLPPNVAAPASTAMGLGCCSKYAVDSAKTANSVVIAARMAMPWRRLPTISPKVKHSAAGIARMASICRKFDSGVAFSKGCAELALKKPPPLVPSSLIASWEATGPMARVCVRVVAGSVTGAPAAFSTGWPCASTRGWS